jgi:hypothetical protein
MTDPGSSVFDRFEPRSSVVDIEEEMCNVAAVVLNEADDLGDFLHFFPLVQRCVEDAGIT